MNEPRPCSAQEIGDALVCVPCNVRWQAADGGRRPACAKAAPASEWPPRGIGGWPAQGAAATADIIDHTTVVALLLRADRGNPHWPVFTVRMLIVLLMLADGPQGFGALFARLAFPSKAALSRALDPLCESGFVKRTRDEGGDQRFVTVALTAAGEAFVRDVLGAA